MPNESQCCGNCKHWRFRRVDVIAGAPLNIGECDAPIPVWAMPILSRETCDEDILPCPAWQAKEGEA